MIRVLKSKSSFTKLVSSIIFQSKNALHKKKKLFIFILRKLQYFFQYSLLFVKFLRYRYTTTEDNK